MEKKLQKSFTDTGLGFPITLLNVTMVKVRGKWTPKIDYNILTRTVLMALSEKSVRLTGNEVRFIRHHHEMTLEQFASRFGVTHAAVIKWEKTHDEPTKMSWAIEKDLRLFVQFTVLGKPAKLAELYSELEKEKSSQKRNIKLDIKNFAA